MHSCLCAALLSLLVAAQTLWVLSAAKVFKPGVVKASAYCSACCKRKDRMCVCLLMCVIVV
jgi:hypothetical protein